MTINNLNTFVVKPKLSLFFTIDARFLFLETDNIKLLVVPMYIFDTEKKLALKNIVLEIWIKEKKMASMPSIKAR